jgi:hypothetical protein
MIRRVGHAHRLGGDHPCAGKVSELGERPREVAPRAHRRQADLPCVIELAIRLDQQHGAHQVRARLLIIAERR